MVQAEEKTPPAAVPDKIPEEPDQEPKIQPEPVKSVEEIIMVQAQDEAKKNQDRNAQLNLLQQQLSKSLAKKQEVDDVISREIDVLRIRIQDIEGTDREGLDSITGVLASLRTTADQKNEL